MNEEFFKLTDHGNPGAVGVLFQVDADLASSWTEKLTQEYVVAKMVVVGANFMKLVEFEKLWSQYLEVISVAMPGKLAITPEMLRAVFDAENIRLDEVVWLSNQMPPDEFKGLLKAVKSY